MSLMPNPYFHSQSPAKFAATILRLAEAHADELRQAFHNAAVMRRDAPVWGRLEAACSKMLERHHAKATRSNAAGEPVWNSRDEKTRRAVEQLLNEVSGKGRAQSYLRAEIEMNRSTAHWNFIFDTTTAAYCRHASLVWMALWYAALAPNVTAAQAALCIGLTVRRKAPLKEATSSIPSKALRTRLKHALKSLGLSV